MEDFLQYNFTLLNSKSKNLTYNIISLFQEITSKVRLSSDSNTLYLKCKWFIDELTISDNKISGHNTIDNIKKLLITHPNKKDILNSLSLIIENKIIESYSIPFSSQNELLEHFQKTYGEFLFTLVLATFLDSNNKDLWLKLGSIYGLKNTILANSSLNSNNKFYFCYSLVEVEEDYLGYGEKNIENINKYINKELMIIKNITTNNKKGRVFKENIVDSITTTKFDSFLYLRSFFTYLKGYFCY